MTSAVTNISTVSPINTTALSLSTSPITKKSSKATSNFSSTEAATILTSTVTANNLTLTETPNSTTSETLNSMTSNVTKRISELTIITSQTEPVTTSKTTVPPDIVSERTSNSTTADTLDSTNLTTFNIPTSISALNTCTISNSITSQKEPATTAKLRVPQDTVKTTPATITTTLTTNKYNKITAAAKDTFNTFFKLMQVQNYLRNHIIKAYTQSHK
ncbi:jg8939 [Pararge aegeria aegeria]|uniref:Jg8939 protein n=1 Tax=Pararge aegeria aegeria TaxID=348720 RepID=A0A8S4RFH2_9NEOP|nr:jg8939 [Pararge aegeria aegeria]